MTHLSTASRPCCPAASASVWPGAAIARDPSLFLFDEPLSNLDAKRAWKCALKSSLLHQRLARHRLRDDQIEADDAGDRIAVIATAWCSSSAPTGNLRPAGQSVRGGFIGSPSMNFLPGAGAARRGAAFALVHEGVTRCCRCRRTIRPHHFGAWLDRELILGIRPSTYRRAERAPRETPQGYAPMKCHARWR